MTHGIVATSDDMPRAMPGAWHAVAILAVANLLSWTDRALPSVMMDPIKHDFALSDVQLAMLTGFSFAACYALFGLPLSWLADRLDRARLITAGIATWCLMTIACGFATDFRVLFVLRMGVGLGEAALIPAAYSLLADLFPPRLLPRPLAVMTLGVPLGSALALLGGGMLHDRLKQIAVTDGLPFGLTDAWRLTLIIAGAAGLAVALWSLLLPEPRRHTPHVVRGDTPGAASVTATSLWSFARGSAFFLVPFMIASTAFGLFSAGFFGWVTPFFTRTYDWSLSQVGAAAGPVTLIAGLLGAPLGAWFALRFYRRTGRNGGVMTILISTIIVAPVAVLAPLSPSAWGALAGLGVLLTAAYAATAVAPAVLMATAPSHLRAQVSAIYLLVAGLVGAGLGPVLYAAFTDRVLQDPAGLAKTMSIVSGFLLAIAIPALVIADRRFSKAIALAD